MESTCYSIKNLGCDMLFETSHAMFSISVVSYVPKKKKKSRYYAMPPKHFFAFMFNDWMFIVTQLELPESKLGRLFP